MSHCYHQQRHAQVACVFLTGGHFMGPQTEKCKML